MAGHDYNVIVNYGAVVAASLTAAVSAETRVNVWTANHLVRELLISNSLDAAMVLTYNGQDWIFLPAGTGGAMDGIQVTIPYNTVIGAYAFSGTPTAGVLAFSGI